MKERDIRVANLKALIAKAGSIAAFARLHNGVDPTYVSQLVNGHRSFGEKAARNMEVKLGLEHGALGLETPALEVPPPGWPFHDISPERYAKLPDRIKGLIEGRALAVIEDWEKSQDAKKPTAA